MTQIYIDPILRKYRELIEAAMPGVFKSFYYGDPIRIPKSSMPALVLAKTQTRLGPLSNTEDQHEGSIILSVIVDLRDEITDDQQIVPGIAQLYDIIEGREDSTYKLKTNSILHVLRSNEIVDAALNLRTDLGTVTRADYGLTIGKRAQDAYAVEGQVEFTSTYSQLRT